jgi:membrane protease YdiL (CAAX protease family)
MNQILSIFTYGFLCASILSLWINKRPIVWALLLAVACGFGLLSHRIDIVGIAVMAILGGTLYSYFNLKINRVPKATLTCFILLFAVVLFHHHAPGFNNWKIVSQVQLSPDSVPYSTYLNFDKTLVGFFILLWGVQLSQSKKDWQNIVKHLVPLFCIGAVVMLTASYLLGYIRWDPKWPPFLAIWAAKNLLFTCLAEEALFRGFIQKELVRIFTGKRWGAFAAILIASVLFGLDHFWGGPKYILLATLAGLFYGTVFYKTGRIESSILFHFLLNLTHITLFSYPALVQD